MPVAANIMRVISPEPVAESRFAAFYDTSTESVMMELSPDGSLGAELASFATGGLWNNIPFVWVSDDPLGIAESGAIISRSRIVDLSTGSVVNRSSLISHCSEFASSFVWLGDGYVYWTEALDDGTGPVAHSSTVTLRIYLRRARLDGSEVTDLGFVEWLPAEWGAHDGVKHTFAIASLRYGSSQVAAMHVINPMTGIATAASRVAHVRFNSDGSGGEIDVVVPTTPGIDFNSGADGYLCPRITEASSPEQRLWFWGYGNTGREEIWNPGSTNSIQTLAKFGDDIEMFEWPFSDTVGFSFWIRGSVTTFSERIQLPRHLGVNPSGIARIDE